MRRIVLNIVLFQIGWFALVLGAAHGSPRLGVMVAITVICIHLAMSDRPFSELLLMGFITVIGATWDSIVTTAGLMRFDSGIFIEGVAPYWLIAMWPVFATTLNVSLRWMKDRMVLALLMGLVGGPLAYLAGSELGAVTFPDTMTSLAVIALGWAVIMPLLVFISSVHDGYRVEALES